MTLLAEHTKAAIVVGVDGTDASVEALRWAAAEAAAHGAPLVAVYVDDPRDRRRAFYAPAAAEDSGAELRAAAVQELISRVLDRPTECVLAVGVPSEVLVGCASDARMLVLGLAEEHRRHDGGHFQQQPTLGAIARACVSRATCPVVVVPAMSRQPSEGGAEPAERQESDLVGGRALYPRVKATGVVRN